MSMKKLIILQAVGCLLFAGVVFALYVFKVFTPITVIIAHTFMGLCNVINANIFLLKPVEELSTHDKLTGCYNRLKLTSKIQEYENFREYAVIFFDIDHFKKVNDTHGHDDGDIMLIKASNQLRFWHKYGDLYRLGGDEFVVVCPNMSQLSLEPILTKWYKSLHILNEEYEDDFICTFSYGVSYKNKSDRRKFDAVMNKADEEMYQMKKSKILQ